MSAFGISRNPLFLALSTPSVGWVAITGNNLAIDGGLGAGPTPVPKIDPFLAGPRVSSVVTFSGLMEIPC
jgi:hypothetical protein